jgi:hypothetical protein
LADLVGENVSEEWDEESFRNRIVDSLAKGSFILIIVVDEINDELRRIVRYLNECSESAFSLHALEMSQFQAGGTEVLVPHLYGLSTKPPVREFTKTQLEYLEFYRSLSEKFGKKVGMSLSEPKGQSYYPIPTGISSVHFEWVFHGRPRNSFGVELHFEKGDKTKNTAMLNEIYKQKDEIEKKTEEKLQIQRNWGRNWARVYIEKNEGNMTPELEEWAFEKMLIFYNQLQPKLEKMK